MIDARRCRSVLRVPLLRRLALLLLPLLALSPPAAAAPSDIGQCAADEVRTISVFNRQLATASAQGSAETIETLTRGSGEVLMIARGPVLGSMDSPDVGIALVCSGREIVLTVSITRSQDFHGPVRQNEIWLPEVTVALQPRCPEILVHAVWDMHLSNGAKVAQARTPPDFPLRNYPVIVSTTVRSSLTACEARALRVTPRQ